MRKKRARMGSAENSPGTTGEGAFITDPHPAPLMKGAKMEKYTYPPAGEEIFNIPDCELEGLNSDPDPLLYPPGVYPPGLRRRPSIYRPGFVYLMVRSSDNAIKIGMSSNPRQRLGTVRVDQRDKAICLLAVSPVVSMRRAEVLLHKAYASYRSGISQEWFNFPPDVLSSLMGVFQAVK